MSHLRRLPVVAMLFIALSWVSCKSDDPSAPLFRGTTIVILDAPEDGVLLRDRPLQLRASVRDAQGADVSSIPVAWSTSDAAVASVDQQGLVTAIMFGDVEVRATGGGTSAVTPLSVRLGVPAPTSRDGDPVTTTLLEGLLRITVPARAIDDGASLHVRPAPAVPPSARLVERSAVELGPSALRFDRPVTIALSYDGVPAGQRSRLRIHRVDDGEWDEVSSVVDPFDQRVRANITRAGTYALLVRPAPSSLVAAAGDGQQAPAGSPVPVPPRVEARDESAAPVEGAVVRFSIASGGGDIVGPDSGVSDASGVAALLGQWRLGPVGGANTLRAALDGAETPSVVFSATATAASLPALIVSHPEVNFDATTGVSPAAREVAVASSNGSVLGGLSLAPVQYTAGGALGWLQASLDRASTPAVLRLAPATASLPANDYVARVTVRAGPAGVAPRDVIVRLGVRHGATGSLVVARQLGGAVSGRAATTQPRVEFRTGSGSPSPVNEAVTAVLVSGTGALRGTQTVTAVSGVATFADLRVDGFGTHRLRFTGGGVSADGAPFNVAQQLASLEIIDQPSDEVEEDRNFPVQPLIRLLDDAGIAYQPAKTVTASIASGPGDLEGNRSVTADDGIARFNNLRIDDGTGPHTIRFSTTTPTLTVTSRSINVRER
jgi:hypothetical protein